jgi:O-antigen/teichoic acid export membrane protein
VASVFSRIRSLGKDTAIYGVSTIVGRLLTFLLVPFYTNVLAPGAFGVVATAYSYIAFFVIVYGYGIDQAYFKFASTRELGGEGHTFSAAQSALVVSSLLLTALLLLVAEPLGSVGGLGEQAGPIVRLSAFILLFDTLSAVPFAVLRLERRAKRFAAIRIAGIVLNVALNVVLLVWVRMGVMGIFVAGVASSAATFALLLPVWRGRFRPTLDRPTLRTMLAFALPVVPAGVASSVVQVIDRPILLWLTDDATVGVYQASYRLGIFMMLVVSMFDYAWRPFFFSHAKDPDAKLLFAKILTWFVGGAGFVLVAVSLFVQDLVAIEILGRRIIHPDYWGGLPIVPVVLAGYLFNGIYVNALAGAYIEKRTGVLPWVTGAGAAANVAVNLALIPVMGMMGAALATLVAYGVMAAAMVLVTRPFYAVPYDWRRVAVALSSAGAVLAVWVFWPGEQAGLVWFGVRALLVLAYPALLVALGFFEGDELGAVRRALRR